MSDRRCVFLAINNLHGGGAERVVIDLARHWPKSEAIPKIVVAEDKGALVRSVPDDVEVIDLGVPLSFRNTPMFVRRLRRVVDAYRPVGVISHLTAMNRMMLRARIAGALPVPLAVVEHNNPSRSPRAGKLAEAVVRAETACLYKRADAVVCVSDGVLDSIRARYSLPKTIGQVILNPIDTDTIQRMATQHPETEPASQCDRMPRPLFVSAGRLHAQKDFSTLIAAFAYYAESNLGSLVILGDGDQRASLEAQVASHGLTDRVSLPGFVQNPWWYMAQADLFVLSSRWEGFANVLVEAMACGTPILSTDCPFGPSEIVSIFKTGSLCLVGDPRAMAHAMRTNVYGDRQNLPPDSAIFQTFHPANVARNYASLMPRTDAQP